MYMPQGSLGTEDSETHIVSSGDWRQDELGCPLSEKAATDTDETDTQMQPRSFEIICVTLSTVCYMYML